MKTKREIIKLWADTSISRLPAETTDIKYKDTSFSYTEIRLLKFICANPGVASVDLSKLSGRTRGTVSIIMKKLTQLEMVYFADDPDHRKRKLIYPTEQGRSIAKIRKKSDEKSIESALDYLEEKYSADEMKIINDALFTLLKMNTSSKRSRI